MTRYFYLNNGFASDAETEEEAKEEAREYFIELLQRNQEVDLFEDE
jgi:hypothetical protein